MKESRIRLYSIIENYNKIFPINVENNFRDMLIISEIIIIIIIRKEMYKYEGRKSRSRGS